MVLAGIGPQALHTKIVVAAAAAAYRKIVVPDTTVASFEQDIAAAGLRASGQQVQQRLAACGCCSPHQALFHRPCHS